MIFGSKPVAPGCRIRLAAEGSTVPLVGDERLLQSKIVASADDLLRRRGFVMVAEKPDLTATISYSTERGTSMKFSSWTSASSFSQFDSGSAVVAGYGVMAATAVYRAFNVSRVASGSSVQTKEYFRHTLAVDMTDAAGTPVWKGETYWTEEQPEIRLDLGSALQFLFTRLPRAEGVLIPIRAVRPDAVGAYVRIELGPASGEYGYDGWFTCPALPHEIHMSSLDVDLDHWRLLPAYLDLLRTAEYALPTGDEFDRPLDPDLWSDVRLGGSYLVEPANERVDLLIDLTGRKDAYRVERCWVADKKEFDEFKRDMAAWESALEKFYDFYEH